MPRIRAEQFRRNVRQAETVPDAFYGTIFADEGGGKKVNRTGREFRGSNIKYEIAKIATPPSISFGVPWIKIKFLTGTRSNFGQRCVEWLIVIFFFFSILPNLKRHAVILGKIEWWCDSCLARVFHGSILGKMATGCGHRIFVTIPFRKLVRDTRRWLETEKRKKKSFFAAYKYN